MTSSLPWSVFCMYNGLTYTTAILKKIKEILTVFKGAAVLLVANDPLRMAGATAFFSMFALPPVLMIIVRAFGLFFDKRTVGRNIMGKVGNTLGNDGQEQIRSVIRAVRSFQLPPLATALVFVFLLFVATTLFQVIKDSINQLWRVRVNKKRHFLSVMISRAKAVGFILFTGALFIAVMAVELMQAYFGHVVSDVSPLLGQYVHSVINHVISLVVITAWFFVLFRFLPDGRPRNGITLVGAMVAGVLFSAGKYILRWALSGNINQVYGTSGALVLILLFVFYTSLILYYSAAFTRLWATYRQTDIVPLPHASGYHITRSDVPATAQAASGT